MTQPLPADGAPGSSGEYRWSIDESGGMRPGAGSPVPLCVASTSPEAQASIHEFQLETLGVLRAEYESAHDCLRRVGRIVSEASGHLTPAFQDMVRVQRLLESLPGLPGETIDAATAAEVALTRDAVRDRLAGAVQGLQFDDLTAQLLDEIRNRLLFLESLSAEVIGFRVGTDGAVRCFTRTVLTDIRQRLEIEREQLAAVLRTVQQESLQTGTTELF